MSFLSRGNAFLERKRNAATGIDVTYQRGVLSAPVKATPNRLQVDQLDEVGIALRLEEWDWIFKTADLAIFDKPKPGDFIRQISGSVTSVYVVTSNGGEPVWRYADENRLAIRVHSKWQRNE